MDNTQLGLIHLLVGLLLDDCIITSYKAERPAVNVQGENGIWRKVPGPDTTVTIYLSKRGS